MELIGGQEMKAAAAEIEKQLLDLKQAARDPKSSAASCK